MADLKELSEKLSLIRQEIKEGLTSLEDSKSVYEYRKTIMDSKAGKIGSLMKEMGKIPNEMKAEYGKMVNEIKNWAQTQFDELDTKLKGQIPGLVDINVVTNCLPSSNCDVMLDSSFTDYEALKGYSTNPAHVAVADTKVRPFTASRTCMDYEV